MVQDPNKLQVEAPPQRTPWQYSLRGLLIATTIVSITLAVGIYLAGVLFVLGVIALTQVATMLAADWLIHPQNRRALAAVSSGSWMILGCGLVLIAGRQAFLLIRVNGSVAAWTFASCLGAAGLYCFRVAANRWRRLSGGDSQTGRPKPC